MMVVAELEQFEDLKKKIDETSILERKTYFAMMVVVELEEFEI